MLFGAAWSAPWDHLRMLLNLTRLPSNQGLKRVPFFCLKGFTREPKPPKKGIRALLGILVRMLLNLKR